MPLYKCSGSKCLDSIQREPESKDVHVVMEDKRHTATTILASNYCLRLEVQRFALKFICCGWRQPVIDLGLILEAEPEHLEE